MKCVIAFGLLVFASISKAQFNTGDAGDAAGGQLAAPGQLGRLLSSGTGSDGQMTNMLGGGMGSMGMSNLLPGAGMPMGGGMFRGMTGATGQMGQMGNLLRMMAARRGMGNGMGLGMGRGLGGMGNMLTYSMLSRGGIDTPMEMLFCQRNPIYCMMFMT